MVRSRAEGFTLVELMITIAIVGVMASVASAGFSTYTRRAHASEAAANIATFGRLLKAYYYRPMSNQGIAVASGERCLPSAVGIVFQGCFGGAPGSEKRRVNCSSSPINRAIGFEITKPTYFAYSMAQHVSVTIADGGACGISTNPQVFHTSAWSDFDEDGARCGMYMAFGVDDNLDLYSKGLQYTTPGGPHGAFSVYYEAEW